MKFNLKNVLFSVAVLVFAFGFMAVSNVHAAAPTILSAAYKDINGDGTVDRVDVTFSESVQVGSTFEVLDWSFPTNPHTLTVTGGSIVGAVVQISVSGAPAYNTLLTATTVKYTNGNTADSIKNGAAQPAATSGAVSAADGAAPVPVAYVYTDGNNDGRVDTVAITMSESGMVINAWNDGEWTIVAGDVGLANETNVTAGGTTLTVTTLGTAGVTGGAAAPTIAYGNATGALHDTAGNTVSNFGPLTIVDNAKPILNTIALSKTATRNRLTLTYSEAMVITNGPSSAGTGDITTAGTLAGLGAFATGGNTTVPTAKNTVAGNGLAIITIDLADQTGGYLNSTSTTEPSGVFTPVLGLTDNSAAHNTMNVAVTPTATGGASWDLTKPTIAATTITVSDANANGKIDTAVLVFPEAMRADSFTNADAALGTTGTRTGTFSGSGTTYTFTRTTDNNAIDTTAAAGDFTYSGATTLLADLFGNLLSATTPGHIVTADKVEADGARPIIASVSPVNLSVNQSNTADIVITFSEPMTKTSFVSYFSTKDASAVDTADTYTATWSVGDTVVNLAHPIYRQKGHVYTAALTTSVTAAGGTPNAILAYSWTFTPSTTRTTVASSNTDITAPTNTSVTMPALTNSSNVTLTLAATDAAQMMIGNNPDFYGMSWETYATTKAWTLPSGNGSRTVYAEFKDATGNVSLPVSATTNVDSSATVTTVVTTTTTPTTPATPASQIEGCVAGQAFSTTSGKSCTVSATPATPGTTTTTTTTTTTSNGVTVVSVFTDSIKYHAKGNEVSKLQQFLKDNGYSLGTVDGSYGPKTMAALKAFQKANGLVADGKFGPKTMAKVNELL